MYKIGKYMKKNGFLGMILIYILLNSSVLHAEPTTNDILNNPDPKYYKQINTYYNNYFDKIDYKKGSGYKPFKRMEWFWEQRLYPDGYIRSPKAMLNDFNQAKKYKYDNALQGYKPQWKELGTKTVPNDASNEGTGLGRINCIELHPDIIGTIWVGSSLGGAWKTTNSGKTWKCADFTTFLSMGVTDIEISQSNSDIMYLSTGDADGSDMSKGYTIGIIKSTDAGTTWNTTGYKSDIPDQALVSELYIHPDNSDIVIAGSNRGIYKTIDGGDTWNLVSSSGNVREMLSPYGHPEIIYSTTMSMGGSSAIYLSKDFGDTWEKVWQNANAERIRLATTKKNPAKVYAIVSDKTYEQNNKAHGLLGIFVSEDYGQTWTEKMGKSPNLLGWSPEGNDLGGQGYYDLTIAASQSDENILVVGGVNTWKSTDGGESWESLSIWYRRHDMPYVHADQHDMVYDSRNGDFFIANDGGIYKSEDISDPDAWEDLSDGISISQFYRMSSAATKDVFLIAGAQDNGTHIYKDSMWMNVGGGDGMDCEINPQNPQIVYSSIYNGSITATFDGFKSQNYIMHQGITREAASWCAPIYLDLVNPNIVYAGFQNVWQSTDQGMTWTKFGNLPTAGTNTVTHITSAPSDNRYLYAAASSNLQKKVGNAEWESIYTAPAFITSAKVDKYDPEKVWVSLSGYQEDAKVYLITPNENINMSAGLPNVPINDLLLMEDNKTLFAATDIGIFIKEDIDKAWRLFNDGMPSLLCNDLDYHKATGTLRVATFGRGIWETQLIDCTIIPPSVSLNNDTEFCDGDSLVISITNPNTYKKIKWSDGSGGSELVVKKSGQYYASVYNESGCEEVTDIINVNVLPFKDIAVKSSKDAFALCVYPDTLVLSANLGYGSYLWSTGSTERKITVTEPGDYWLEVTAKNGCTGRTKIFNIRQSEYPNKPSISQENEELVCNESAYAYQWFVSGKAVDNSNSQRIIPKKTGLYTVQVFNEPGCSAISDEYEAIAAVNVEVDFSSQFEIFPNPANKTVNIDFYQNGGSSAIITIINIEGKEIEKLKPISFDNRLNYNLNVENLDNGIYFLKVESGSAVNVKRFVKN